METGKGKHKFSLKIKICDKISVVRDLFTKWSNSKMIYLSFKNSSE